MNKHLAGYLATAAVMVALDMVWLGAIARTMYQQSIGHLMAEHPNWPVAVVFYAIYAAGLMVFAVSPQAGEAAWGRTVVMGALFGFFAYATYDLTNLATLANWPLRLTLIDMTWGSFVSGLSAGAGKAAMTWAASA